MYFKLNPIISKYINVNKLLDDSLIYYDDDSSFGRNTGINRINENPHAVHFLLENIEYLSTTIFQNPGFIPYIQHAWKNINNVYDGAFLKSYEMDAMANHLFCSNEDWALKCMLCNPGLTLDRIMQITGYSENKIKQKLHIAGELTSLSNYGDLFTKKMLALNTNKERTELYETLQSDYWFLTNPRYFEISIELYNISCIDESARLELPIEQYLDIAPGDLHPELLKIIKSAKHGIINSDFVCSYYARHFNAITREIPELGIVDLKFMPLGINIMNYPEMSKKNYNNYDLFWIFRSVGCFDFFKCNINMASKWKSSIWKQILDNKDRSVYDYREYPLLISNKMISILQAYADYLGCSVEEAIEKTPNLKYAIYSIGKTDLHNPDLFVDDYVRNAEKNKVFFRELMENVWSPKRVEKLLEAGIDPDDF